MVSCVMMAVLGGRVSGANKMGAGGWKPCLYLCLVSISTRTCGASLIPRLSPYERVGTFPYCKQRKAGWGLGMRQRKAGWVGSGNEVTVMHIVKWPF